MKNYNHIFTTKEQPTQDKTNMCVSLLIDTSGSVSSNNNRIQMDTAYTIIKALEQLKNKSEVIEFSGNPYLKDDDKKFKVIKAFNQKAEHGDFNRHFCEGNELNPALKKAHGDLLKETIKNKFIIVITDGGLKYDGNTIPQMTKQAQEIRKNNIPIYCILVNPRDYERYDFFDRVIKINNFNEIVTELKKLICEIQTNIIRGIK